ncbi:hypothetical protein C1H46_033535 [Malus baccata]|uniref:Uncharacterized protein n=1 Tax=Malus baccata TaxID=106549 RepID=A0A540L375_MALBA|nr:hypothetical protein C1H46_033535 [Malus baccata]
MAAPRNLGWDAGRLPRDEKNAKEDDWSTDKKLKSERFPLSRWELAAALTVVVVFSTGLSYIYMTMPAAEYSKLKLPRTIVDLRLIKLQLLIRDLETDGAPLFSEFSFAGQSIHLNHFLRVLGFSTPSRLTGIPCSPNREEEDWYHYHRHRCQGHCITRSSGMLATYVIQPIDMIKVRIQLGQGSATQVMRTMIKEEGVGALPVVVHDTR